MIMYEEELILFLQKARKDVDSFHLLATNDSLLENALFHAQQAVEKWLKALIALTGMENEKTHNLVYLLKLIQQHHLELNDSKFQDYAALLTPYAVNIRYYHVNNAAINLKSDIDSARIALADFEALLKPKFSDSVWC